MNVKEIVDKYLVDNGFEGLFNADDECACEICDLAPCGAMNEECAAGYRVPCDADPDEGCEFGDTPDDHFHMGAKKPEGRPLETPTT